MVGWTRRQLMVALVVLVAVAVLVPVLLSLELAQRQARAELARRAAFYAADVLRRTEATGDQMVAAFARLGRIPQAERCAALGLAVMRDLDAQSPYLQMLGVARDGALVCSSYGVHVPAIPLGPVDYLARTGFSLRRDVSLPFAPGARLAVFQQGPFVALVHSALPVDTTVADPGTSLAVVGVNRRLVFAQRGAIDPQWLQDLGRLAPGASEAQVVAGRAIARMRSRRFPEVAVLAALDARATDGVTDREVWVLVPIGFAIGALLAWVLVHLARIQASPAAAIRSGLRHGEFFLAYQPIVRLAGGRWVGVEALLRWRRDDGRLVAPNLFIPIAEESDLICALTARLVHLVEPVLKEFAAQQDFFVALNLSPRDLHAAGTLDLLRGLVERTGAKPGQLHLEITERAFADTAEARSMVRRLRELGFHVAIDDFGTGYSSLSELTSFELDAIKIDKAFVDTIGSDAVTSHIAFHIVEMAHKLSLDLVAEGIEHEPQADMLRTWGVAWGQGWLFSPPLSIEQLREGMRRGWKGAGGS